MGITIDAADGYVGLLLVPDIYSSFDIRPSSALISTNNYGGNPTPSSVTGIIVKSNDNSVIVLEVGPLFGCYASVSGETFTVSSFAEDSGFATIIIKDTNGKVMSKKVFTYSKIKNEVDITPPDNTNAISIGY